MKDPRIKKLLLILAGVLLSIVTFLPGTKHIFNIPALKIKPILIVVLGVVALCYQTVRASDVEKPKMVMVEKVHDFGTIKEKGGPVTCEFKFRNDGAGNLVILDARADCGCTRPEFPKKPVGPGQEGVIKVVYNPLGAPGAFEKVITVRTNGKPSKVRFKIRGSVLHQ